MIRHRHAFFAVTFGCGLLTAAASSAAYAQETATPPKKIFGYLDPKTGTFKAANTQVRPDASTTPATTGTVSLTISIKLATVFPAKSTIACGMEVSALSLTENTSTGAVSDGEWLETASSPATISGSTATCTVKIPYAWVLPAAGTSGTTTTTNTLTADFQVTVSNATAAVTVLRTSEQQLIAGEKVPATGTVSSYTANVTL